MQVKKLNGSGYERRMLGGIALLIDEIAMCVDAVGDVGDLCVWDGDQR